MATSKNFAIKGAILSYPNLYSPELYQGKETEKPQFSAVFLFDDQDTYDRMWELGMETAAEEFGSEKKIPKNFKRSERCAINEVSLTKDDNGIDFDGWSIKAKGGQTRAGAPKKILTYDRSNELVGPDDGTNDENGIFYPGCKVSAQITLWTAATYPHLRANLLLVRFAGDGELLGGGSGVSAADLLEGLGDDDEADI